MEEKGRGEMGYNQQSVRGYAFKEKSFFITMGNLSVSIISVWSRIGPFAQSHCCYRDESAPSL